METARLIVCEQTGCWAVALRGALADPAVRVWETRSLAECLGLLAQLPCSFLVAELTAAAADDLPRFLARLEREFPRVRAAVVAQRGLADYQWLMREAGAIHFTCSPRQLAPLAEAACRHLSQAEVPETLPSERIWANLPWKGR